MWSESEADNNSFAPAGLRNISLSETPPKEQCLSTATAGVAPFLDKKFRAFSSDVEWKMLSSRSIRKDEYLEHVVFSHSKAI